MAAVERGLFPNNVEAAKYKNAELYTMIKKYDKEHGVDESPVIQQSVPKQEQEKAEQKTAEQPKAEVEKADEEKTESSTPNNGNKKPRRLPSKESKQKAKSEQNGVVKDNSESVGKATDNVHQKHTVEQQTVDSAKSSTKKDEKQKVDLINYDNPKPFRTLLLSLLRKQFGVNYSSLKNSGLTKKNYTRAIDYLNESIDVARLVLGSMVETEILVHVVGKDGKVTDGNVYIHRDMIAEELAKLESDENTTIANKPETKVDDKPVATADGNDKVEKESVEYEQSDEEKEIADTIVATFNMLKVELDTIRKENEELKKENLKLQAKISNNQRHDVDVHDSLVDFMNKLSNTKDEHYVWVWKEINKIVSAKLPVATDKSPVVLDIEKLIIEESVRLHNEAEAKRELEEKKARALEEDTMYEGTNISYIDGDVAKPDGVKKKVFNVYKEWYDDCKMWVEYVVDRMAEIDSIGATKKRKSAISNLESELDDWYGEWYDSDCDEDTVDMVVEVMGDLIHSNRNSDKALSNLVAIIDELELV